MIAIGTTTFDTAGHVIIRPLADTTDGETARRVARVTTLDGGVSVSDRGYSEGDRNLVFIFRTVSKAHNNQIERIVRLYSRVHVVTERGVYLAAPEYFTPGVAQSTLALLVIERLTQD